MVTVYLSDKSFLRSLTSGNGISLVDSNGTITISVSNTLTNGAIQPAHLADVDAANDTIYYSTTASKLVYKDSGGTVRNLY